jgi:GxxExxY protein
VLIHAALTEQVIGLAIEVHRALGPGLLESAYHECLCYELAQAKIPHASQQILPLTYKEIRLDAAYRMDIVVDNQLVLEIKSVDQILPVHQSQLLTYLRLSGHRVGLILNFNVPTLKQGLRRLII